MSFISRATAGLSTRAGEPRGTGSLRAGANVLRSLSAAGRRVTPENAMGLSAVWASIWLIADQGGGLPLRMYTGPEDALAPANPNVVPRWVAAPNPECSPIDVWTVAICHMEGWGNAYIGKQKELGRVVHLWNIEPWRVAVRRDRGVKVFDVIEDDGSFHTYTSDEIIHIKGRSLDGFTGASPIQVHANTLGIALALDDFAGDTFRNRAIPPGILSVKGVIKDDTIKDDMRDEWHNRYGYRPAKRDKTIAILDNETKFQALSIPLVDAQFIEQRNYTIQDIARIYGVSPEDIGGESGGSMTYSNVQARRADLLQFVLWSRLSRVQGALKLHNDLCGQLVPRFDDTAFVRGDPREQFETLRAATGGKPILTQDEARHSVGRRPLGGKAAELDFKSTSTTGKFAGGQSQEDSPA